MDRIKPLFAAVYCLTFMAGIASAQKSVAGPFDSPVADTPVASAAKPAHVGAENTAANIEDLKRRIEELENLNRTLTQALSDVKTKVDAMIGQEPSRPLDTSAAPVAQATIAAKSPDAPLQDEKSSSVHWPEILSEGNRLKLYGFLRLDLITDSQRPNNAQGILFITSPDPRGSNTTNGDFALHPRLTRFGLDFIGPRIAKLGNAKLTGKFETDFQNGGTESQQIIRIRHAYFNLAWKDFSLLAGQTWDTASPLIPTVSNQTLLWNAGNVGDRRPQLRAAYEPRAGGGRFSFIGGVGLTGAIDSLDLDANGVRDGEESSRPSLQSRIGYSHSVGSSERIASVGVSGYYGFMRTGRPVAGLTEFRSQLINVDFTLPLSGHISLKGEGWWGRNLSDIRGGIGQGLNVATGQAIRGRGGWGEASFKLSRVFSFHPGFSTDDPVDEDLPAAGRTRNRTFYLAHRIAPGGGFLLGVDYLRWRTTYKGLQPGVDNRLNLFFQYGF